MLYKAAMSSVVVLMFSAPQASADNFTTVHVTGNTPAVTSQGTWLQWNRMNGDGQSWILNQMGGGSPGINLGEVDTSNNVTLSATFTPTAASLPGSLTVTGSAFSKSPVSTANGLALTTAAWVKQFFPGLSVSVLGTGTPGLDGGTWFATRTDTSPDFPPVIRVDRNFNYNGGQVGGVTPALNTNCNLGTYNPQNYVWCNQTIMNTTAYGSGQHVALASTVRRGVFTDGNGPRAIQWAGYFENDDRSRFNSDQAGAQVGIENDIYSHGTDANHKRIILQMEIGDQSSGGGGANVGYGIPIGRNDSSSTLGTGIRFNLPIYEAGISFAAATLTGNAPAILLSTNQPICFETTLQRCVRWDGATDNFGSGTLSAAGYNTVSDERLKTHVAQLDPGRALDIVNRIKPVDFVWADEKNFGVGPQIGFLAQDMQRVVPEVVGVGGNGLMSIDYSKLVPLLVGAIKEQSLEIDDLRLKLSKVEKQ